MKLNTDVNASKDSFKLEARLKSSSSNRRFVPFAYDQKREISFSRIFTKNRIITHPTIFDLSYPIGENLANLRATELSFDPFLLSPTARFLFLPLLSSFLRIFNLFRPVLETLSPSPFIPSLSFVSLISGNERGFRLIGLHASSPPRDRYNCEWDYTLVRILFNAFTLCIPVSCTFARWIRTGMEKREGEREKFYRITTRSSIIIVAKDWFCCVTTPYSTMSEYPFYFLLSNVRIVNASGI